ncbi:MAG: hypothetical protein WAM60_04755 [Candidatus Promineifilaceae bacterium]
MAYDLEAIRKLLSAAFSSSEIQTLAFDRFHEVYEDFTSGMAKSRMVEAVVERAIKSGRIPDLLDYVKAANPYQYQRFAPQLELSTPSNQPILTFGDEVRLQDLQSNIDREVELLREYEEQLTYEDDSRRLRKIQHEIERQKKTIAGYQQQAAEIQSRLSSTPQQESGERQNQLDEISQKLSALSKQIETAENHLAEGQKSIREDIRQQQEAVLAHIDAQYRQTVAVLVKKMDANQLEVTELLLDAADQQQIAQWEAENLTLLAQQALVELKQLHEEQPDSAEWQSLLNALAKETGWEQKLKLTVPLVPGVLGFESEIKMDVVPMLSQAWERLVKRVRGGE